MINNIFIIFNFFIVFSCDLVFNLIQLVRLNNNGKLKMSENKKLKRFKHLCSEAVLDFKAGPQDENTEYIAKQFQTLKDFEKVKPRIMPPEKSMALVFINMYLEKSLISSTSESEIVRAFLPQISEVEQEQKFMHDYIKERYEFLADGRIVTLNKSHSFLKV